MRFAYTTILTLLIPVFGFAQPTDGNRLTYLDGNDPYYVSRTFPKLTTPQWVGEEGVEAVVILAIDDMRDHKRYEAYLRPILQRLKKIDGRAPVSIMTNRIDPKEPHLQQWLKEGLSLEVHTYDHPCPFFKSRSFAKAKETYDKCVDLMAEIPNSHPVAFRMPCCDSLNTPSPRFYAEIFNKRTKKGNFLTIDTSVFQLFTANDPELPRELVLEKDGTERFRKYLPKDRTFVNTIEDYPYPYVIGRLCWEFPCMVPSDWEAQHLHKPNNPITVEDWKAALDATVIKQGVFNMVFHPHGWIQNSQIVKLIDYAVSKHGKKVKFLTFKEAQERINRHLLAGHPIRHPKHGSDNGVRLMDVNDDGFLDVVIGNEKVKVNRLWNPKDGKWRAVDFPVQIGGDWRPGRADNVKPTHFGYLKSKELPSMLWSNQIWHFDGKRWVRDKLMEQGLKMNPAIQFAIDTGCRLIDLDGDGHSEVLCKDDSSRQVVLKTSQQNNRLFKLKFTLPSGASLFDTFKIDTGLRFADLNEDGKLDIIFSNEEQYGIYLFENMKTGWSRKVIAGKASDKNALPMISYKGTNFGMWVHSRHLWWSNETTTLDKDFVARRSINDLLKEVEPKAKSPEASLKCIQVRPGFKAELVAAEPLVMDPIAFAWGPDGKLWVVEMGDYPLGVDGKGKHGGNVKFLEDTDGDGKYDKAMVFLDKLGYPSGVLPWKKGVLVTCAPDIFYAEDLNGDGKADRKITLFTGFKEGNQQHRVNSLVWGLDNWIHVANGDSGGAIKSLKTGKTMNIGGRDLRIKPDTGEMEPQTGQTQFGLSRDDWDNWFGNNNSHPMFHFVLDDHYLKRNPFFAPPSPKVEVSVKPGSSPVYPISPTLERFNNPQSVNHFTSACSTIVYRDNLFGPMFSGNAFTSEPVHNLVHREIMQPKGLTFTSWRAPDEQQSEFLASSDNWFRPAMIQTGPDGALWVADMYRYVIEHPQWIPLEWQKKLDLRAGHDKGRIYRIAPVGKALRKVPRFDKLDTADLVAALESPNGWQRDMAHMMLLWEKDKAAVPLLEKMAIQSKQPLGRVHALCVLDGLGELNQGLLRLALKDSHPGVRKQAVRLCEPLLNQSDILGPLLLKMVSATEKDLHVQMQLAYSLGEWKQHNQVGVALGMLAMKHHDDKYFVAAVMSSVNKNNLQPTLFAILTRQQDAQSTLPLVETLVQQALRHGDTNAVRTLLFNIVNSNNGRYEPWQFASLAGLLDVLDAKNSSLEKLAPKGDIQFKHFLMKLPPLFQAARTVAADAKANEEHRLAAVALLGRGPDKQQEDVKLLASLLAPQTPTKLQLAAVTTMGKLRNADAAAALLKRWKSYTPQVRSEIMDILLSRQSGVQTALNALKKEQILPMEISAAHQQRLLQHKSAKIRKRAQQLLAGSIDPDRQKVLTKYRDALIVKGDRAQGKIIFEKTCAACHHLGGIGNKIGPDLAQLSGKSPQTLLEAIIDPNRAVEAKYLNYTAMTTSGISFSGLLTSETATSITIAGVDGKEKVILRADLEEMFSAGKSAMPEGLEKDISPKQMADLLSYLSSNIPAAKVETFPGNKPQVIRPAKGGSAPDFSFAHHSLRFALANRTQRARNVNRHFGASCVTHNAPHSNHPIQSPTTIRSRAAFNL